MKTKDLFALLPQDTQQENIWQANLRAILEEWARETGDNPQPVSAVEEYLYEVLSEQRRSGNLGRGIFLSTVHSIKGLEFDHVFVIDGSWNNLSGTDLEEERRLYYVAMSRARESLHLFSLNGHNPHCAALSGDSIVRRNLVPAERKILPDFHYALLTMKDLYIDYAGRKPPENPIHGALAQLGAGDLLQAERRNDGVELINPQGLAVARLAKNACQYWLPRLDTIREIKVVAMVQRRQFDIHDKDFVDRCRMESWEIPLVELKVNCR